MDTGYGRERRRISSTEAAFAGFGLVRRRPTLFFGLMALIVIMGLITSVLQVMIAGPAMTQLMQLQFAGAHGGVAADPATFARLMRPIWQLNLILAPLGLLFYAMANAAVYRAVLRPQDSAFGYLRLGADELRQAGALVLLWLSLMAIGILAEIGVLILGVLGAIAVAGAAHGEPVRAAQFTTVLFIAIALFLIGTVLLFGVRLSLAGPVTFAERRVRLTASWRLTRGRFWPMLGAYFLAGVIMMLAALVVMVLSCLFAFVLGGLAGVRDLFFGDTSSLASFYTPERIVLMVLNAPVYALWLGILAAVPAALYAQMAPGAVPEGPADLSHSFGAAPGDDSPATLGA